MVGCFIRGFATGLRDQDILARRVDIMDRVVGSHVVALAHTHLVTGLILRGEPARQETLVRVVVVLRRVRVERGSVVHSAASRDGISSVVKCLLPISSDECTYHFPS